MRFVRLERLISDDELDEVSQADYDEVVRLERLISDDELDEVSEADYDEVCEVGEADQ